MKLNKGDMLRVIDASRTGGYLKKDQVVTVKGSVQTADHGQCVALEGHGGIFTLDQFAKYEPMPCDQPEHGLPVAPKHITTDPKVRAFSTGATRDLDTNKLDYEGFLSPLVLKRYAEHMHKARQMPNGDVRASDNWQLGIPKDVYMKSLFRHFFDVWSTHRGYSQGDIEAELCALLFNANGYLHEHLKAKRGL